MNLANDALQRTFARLLMPTEQADAAWMQDTGLIVPLLQQKVAVRVEEKGAGKSSAVSHAIAPK
jgi:hypothetical protein